MAPPRLLWNLKAMLGEGPVWRAHDSSVWFVDIKAPALHRFGVQDGAQQTFIAPDQIGFALPAEDGAFICGVRGGLYRFDPDSGGFTFLQAIEQDRPQNRLNDGFVAPDGALWFGTMDDSEQQKSGALYRWHRGDLQRKDDGYGVTNGPALSPDETVLYHNDTLDKAIYAFDHAAGSISNKRLFARTEDGFADGPCVDSAGVLHVALFNGWGVAQFAPDGARIGTIALPVPAVTKVCFGGDELKTLFCTTARLHQSAQTLEQAPLSGGLFAVDVDTPGLPQALIRL
jgi:sugar lactone lactonase YvrE